MGNFFLLYTYDYAYHTVILVLFLRHFKLNGFFTIFV